MEKYVPILQDPTELLAFVGWTGVATYELFVFVFCSIFKITVVTVLYCVFW